VERVYGEKPDVSNLIAFYTPGVYHKTKEERKSSWDWKRIPCRFLGYDPAGKNSFIILDLLKNKSIIRKNVKFGNSLIDLSIPLPEESELGSENRNDYDILLEDPYEDLEIPFEEVKDEKMEVESDILQNFLDPNDFVEDEEVPLWENLLSQMENDETPYWKSEPEENERVDEKVSEDNSDDETDKESLFLTQCLLSEWVHEVHG